MQQESHPDRNMEDANPDTSITEEFVSATDEQVPEEVEAWSNIAVSFFFFFFFFLQD